MTTKKKSVLGRGLSALLDDSNVSIKKINNESKDTPINYITEIPLDRIEVNPFQPRTEFDKGALQELADSIKKQGIIQPITVRKLSEDKYQLIAGERRFQASKMCGKTTIPAFVRTANDQQMLELALIENIQREDLTAIEIALSYQRLITECSLKQEELGDRVGKNRSTVNNYLRLLKLPPEIQAGLRDKKIGMGHARALINVNNVEEQLDIYQKTVKDDLSVRKVESMVRDLLTVEPEVEKPVKTPAVLPKQYEMQIKNVQSKLSSQFGTKITIKSSKENKGEISIPFVSAEELNRILELLHYQE